MVDRTPPHPLVLMATSQSYSSGYVETFSKYMADNNCLRSTVGLSETATVTAQPRRTEVVSIRTRRMGESRRRKVKQQSIGWCCDNVGQQALVGLLCSALNAMMSGKARPTGIEGQCG